MSSETNIDPIWAELRKAFDPKVVGKLPKGGTQLDYVGHAAVTDRLLTVDPLWTWEPLALDDRGLPAYDNAGGLWIKLTVHGVTRLGYGDGPDPKQRIGDALRNAAMRFGVALDLWSKDELESTLERPETKNKPDRKPRETVKDVMARITAELQSRGFTDSSERKQIVDGVADGGQLTLNKLEHVAYVIEMTDDSDLRTLITEVAT